ncbi:MAG: hypothetical protein EHM33_00965 [Chloroflexi bacterium]|nr:MAG: hypothetical protein EHM33_00965 [Chloroflexota bacterium]
MTTAYTDYTYYTTTYLGTSIASADFARLALRASAVIDSITFGRAATDTDNTDAIEMATCAVAEEYQRVELDGNADGIASESIGSNSVTYTENSAKQRTANEKYIASAAVYLGSTGLMFPGFAAGEYSGESASDED